MSKITNAKRLNKVNMAERDLAKKLGRIPTHQEREEVRAKVDSELEVTGDNGHETGGDPSDWRTFAISQKDLFAKKLEPIQFLVADLLPTPGLACLGGKKKLGKSWLALDLAQRTASGTEFLGRPVKQGKVLCLALEDGQRRLRGRLERLHSDPCLPITYVTTITPLNSPEGMIAFEDMIKTEAPALVIIDTLASAKDKQIDEDKASGMADLMNQLHALALTYSLTILVIAHHGKKGYSDPGFDIRGSSATPSASDCNIGLYRNGDGSHDLKAEGRDIADTELRLYFDTETWCFQLKGDARDERRAEAEDKVIEAIEALGGEADATMIAGELGLNRVTVQDHLKRMRESKQLDSKRIPTGRTKKMMYSLMETYPTTPTSLQRKDTVDEVGGVDKVVNVGNVENLITPLIDTLKDNAVVEVDDVAPISEVKTDTLPEELPVEVIKNLGMISGEGLYPCIKSKGGCCLQSKYTKQPFACAYSPAKCPFFRGTK